MHLRVPSGTSGCLLAAGICACDNDSEDVSKAETAARIVRWRRVFICVVLMIQW